MNSQGDPPPVRVEVLGPLRLVVDGTPVDVRGPRRRAVLALLALAEGRTVTVDRLVESLWPSAAPELGRQTLHTHVSRLRADFGVAAGRLQTGHDGYRIDLGDDNMDVTRARSLLTAARAATHSDPERTFAMLSEADALWRGPVLADLTDIPAIASAVEGYERLHRDVTDALIVSATTAGHAEDVLGLAMSSLSDDPLREPAVLGLMRALAATGQSPAALQAGREYRHRLVDETGLDPSPALNALERDIASGTTGAPPAPVSLQTRTDPAVPANRLIGRESQIAALHRLLAEQRLVTITGPGGVGKSRVALELAPGGTAMVLLLAPVTDPAGIPHALAAALRLTVVQDEVLSACVAVLSDYRGLLMIDNCEHLLDAVRDLTELLLTACPGLTILATSRERLGLAAEFVYRLIPLTLPAPGTDGSTPDPEMLRKVPSIALFLDRAARVRPGTLTTPAELRLVADIVRRLDGIPLAIELAAVRLSSFSLIDLHRRLDRSLDLLGGGRATGDRHRTLRATVEWSYDLLPDDEQRLFRHLAVFVDGIDLDAAERLAIDLGLTGDPGTALAHLVDSSMIDADLTVGTRYRMLETLRAFGNDRLVAAGEDEEATRHLISWAVELVNGIGAALASDDEPAADALLRRELPNLRAGWQGARAHGSVDDAAAMVASLFSVVGYRDLVEIRSWADDLADDPALLSHHRAAAVVGVAAESAYQRGDLPRAERLARSGIQLGSGSTDAWFGLTVLSVVDLARGEFTAATEHAIAAAAMDVSPADNLVIAALAMTYAGDAVAARELCERGRACAVSPTALGWVAYVAGEIESSEGRNVESQEHYARAIELGRTSGAAFLVGVASVGLLSARTRAGSIHDTLLGFREVIDYFARTGNWNHLWVTLRNLADLLRRLGEYQPAALIDAAADQAPDAPAAARFAEPESPADSTVLAPEISTQPIPGRQIVLEMARAAIERKLKRS